MDILIKNMEMPKSCEKCPLKCVVKSNPMIITNKGVSRLTKEKNCPLIPVPEHGDLIDRDALSRRLVKWEEEALFDKDIVRASAYKNVQDILNKSAVVLEKTT